MRVLEDKKGFTLIELLAVIVVLAIVMLIATVNVTGALGKARKLALMTEGGNAVDAAKLEYQFSVLDGSITTGSACYSLKYLHDQGTFEKGTGAGGDNYTGSVLVEDTGTGYEYKFWISNGSHAFVNATHGKAKWSDAVNASSADDSCGGAGKKVG